MGNPESAESTYPYVLPGPIGWFSTFVKWCWAPGGRPPLPESSIYHFLSSSRSHPTMEFLKASSAWSQAKGREGHPISYIIDGRTIEACIYLMVLEAIRKRLRSTIGRGILCWNEAREYVVPLRFRVLIRRPFGLGRLPLLDEYSFRTRKT